MSASNPTKAVPSRDEFVDAMVNKVIAEWEGEMPPWFLQEMREQLTMMCDAHPVAAALVDGARPRAVPEQSATQPVEVARNQAQPPLAGLKTGTDDDGDDGRG
ncbi:MAG: hypothetical protein AAF715_32720 [Myxococcota bacterium]